MLRYTARRIAITLPLLAVATFLVFVVGRMAPGDPIALRLGDHYDPVAAERIRRELGLDRPVLVQFGYYLAAALRGDFGESFVSPGRRVSAIVRETLPISLRLTAFAIVVAAAAGTLAGIVGAVRERSHIDRPLQFLILSALSVPNFVVAALLVLILAVWAGAVPVAGLYDWKGYVLPVVVLAIPPTAYITRVTRASMLQTMQEDYVRTARSKGLGEGRVVLHHALRNAALPIITQIGLSFGYALTAFVVEVIFNIPGMARVGVEAILERDYAVIQTVTLVYLTIFILLNLLVDISYALFDPRVRF